jgi:hypothetical protein
MRLWLLDRIRWLVKPRKPAQETGSAAGSPGRHRKGERHRSWRRAAAMEGTFPAAGGSSDVLPPAAPGGSPATAHDGSPASAWPAPGRPPAPGAPLPSGAAPGPRGSRGPRAAPAVRAARAGPARARIREAPGETAPVGVDEVATPVPAAPAARQRWYEAAAGSELTRVARRGVPEAHGAELTQTAPGVPRQSGGAGRSYWRTAREVLGHDLPRADAHPLGHPVTADGRRNCGSLEEILWRQWDQAAPPPAEVVAAVDRLAELPERIKERLADGLDAIFVGPGGVPELDDMTALRGVPLPSGQASWDACAGAYGERKIVVGSQPSPTPDVMCHEVGHALDDLDSPPGKWQSDSAEFRMLYDQCQPHLASDFHRQPGGLGRKEFFADAFAAIASRQRPALVDMLSGDTRTALRIMLYFNRRYGI